jgi:hypothetical protein
MRARTEDDEVARADAGHAWREPIRCEALDVRGLADSGSYVLAIGVLA